MMVRRENTAAWLIMLLTVSSSMADDLGLPEVLIGLRAAERAVPALQVTQHIVGQKGAVEQRLGVDAEQRFVFERPGDSAARWFVDTKYTDPGSGNAHHETAFWDGQVLRKLDVLAAGRQGGFRSLSGTITRDAGLGMPYGSPLDCLWWHQGLTISEMLAAFKGAVLTWRAEGSERVAVIEIQPVPSEKYEFHVAPAMGFAVIYRAGFVPSKTTGEWLRDWQMKCSQWREYRAGLWLPGRVEEEFWLGIADGRPYLVSQLTRSMQWHLEPNNLSATFKLEFPADTLVNDTVTQKVYREARVTDQMIADQVAVARRLAQEQGEQPATGASARMVFAVCLAALAAGGMTAYRIKRRRRAA